MSYDNTNSFVLFKNDKDGNEARPDYTGKLTDESGKEWRIAAWIKDGAKGKFMSGKISEPLAQRTAAPVVEPNDELPF